MLPRACSCFCADAETHEPKQLFPVLVETSSTPPGRTTHLPLPRSSHQLQTTLRRPREQPRELLAKRSEEHKSIHVHGAQMGVLHFRADTGGGGSGGCFLLVDECKTYSEKSKCISTSYMSEWLHKHKCFSECANPFRHIFQIPVIYRQ